jgi:HPt (histidine-containing phosphotransfer) domain-containing protein
MKPDLDLQRLQQIGAPEDPAVVAILQRFVTTLDGRVAEVTAAAAEAPAALAHQLHQLAGSAANCGFAALADFCRKGEIEPGTFDAATLSSLAESATAAWNQLVANLPPRS